MNKALIIFFIISTWILKVVFIQASGERKTCQFLFDIFRNKNIRPMTNERINAVPRRENSPM